MRFNRRRSRRSKNTNEGSQEAPGSAEDRPSHSGSQERNNLDEGASSAELLEQAQNPNRLVSDWLEKSVNENPEELNSRYGQSVQEVSTHFAHKAINQNEESAENRRKSYPNVQNPEKTRKISKILSLILGEGPSSSTLPTRESEVSDEYPEQAREINEIKQKVDLAKVSADELRKLAESVELLQSKNGSKNEASSIQAEDEMNQSATAERSDSKQFSKTSNEAFRESQSSAKEEFEKNISKSSNDKISSIPEEEKGNNKQQLESETKASAFSLKKFGSKSSVRSSKPTRSTSSIQNQELKITESIDYYGNSSKDEAPADAPDDRQLINNESASSQSPILDVVRSLDNLEPLSPTSESVENVSTHEKSIKTASKISFQEIIAQTSTDDLVRVLSQVSKKTSRADIMEKLASATNLAASNDDKKSSISAAESFGRKSSSIPAHDKTFLEGGSISSNKSNKDQVRKSGSSKVSRPISQARSAASSTRSADSPVLSQNGKDEKLSTKSGSSKISRASMPVSQTRSAAFSSRSLGENESAVLPQNSEDEKLSTKSGSSKASLDRILRKSSGRSSVPSEKKITDNLADDKSTKSSRMPEAKQGELESSSEEENVPKKLISELLNSIESGDEKEDKSFSETEEAKEREDLKEPSTSQRRITRGKLRSFISEKSLKSVRSGSQASIAAGKSIDEKHYISRTGSVKSTEDVIRSSNSVANSVLNDILKVTKEDTSEDLIANEDTGEITQEAMLSGSNNSLAEKKRSEKDHDFKVPPTPKPSRASMNDQSASPRLEEHRKSVPESAIDILRDLQEPGDLPSTPFNSKSSLNSDKQSLQVEEESRISIAESPESRRKTIPESAIDVLRELQQPKDLPSTPANSLDSQNSQTRSEDSKVSVAASSNSPDRRKTIPESAIDILRDLQQSKDLPSTPHPSKTSMNSDKISDPNLFPDDQPPRKSILESAIEIIQNQEAPKSSAELSSDQNLMTDTDGEGFSETEEAKNMDQDIEPTSQRRITRGKLQSFIKSQESVASEASFRSENQVLSMSQKSATPPRGIISNNSFGKEIIEDQAGNPPSISSKKSKDEKSMSRKSSLRSQKSSSGSSNSNNTAGKDISEDDPPVIERRITRGKLSSFINSKEMLASQSHKSSNSENDEQDEILHNSNSESRASIRTKSGQSNVDSKISKSSIVSEKISERIVNNKIDAHEEIIADSLILSENADNAKSGSKISTRSRKSSKIEVNEEDHPVRTASSIAKSLVREITEMQEPQASPSKSSVKSTRSSIKSQTSVSKKDELQSDEIVKIALDIYESFLSSTTREIIEEVAKEEGIAIESNSDISLRSSEYSKTSVKEATSASKSLSIKSSKRSQTSDRSSRRSSARLRSQKSGEIPVRTHSSIANSFVRHVLDDAQKNLLLVEEKDAERSSEKSEISEKSSTVISEHKIDKTLSKLKEINRASSHSSGSQLLSNISMPKSENPTSFKNIDSDFELNKPQATSSRISTRSRRTENSEKFSTVEGTKSSRISTRSRSSSKKSVTEKFSNNSTDSLSNRPRTRSNSSSRASKSSPKVSKSSSKASKPQSSSSKISTRSSNRLKGKPIVSDIKKTIRSNSSASSLSLSGSKNSKSQTRFSNLAPDGSEHVTYITSSRETNSSTSPLPQMKDFSDKESAISSTHSNSRNLLSETAKSSEQDLAMNSKSTLSDCNKSEEPAVFTDLPARISSNTTTSTKNSSNVASSLLAPELITTETIWRAPSLIDNNSRSDSPSTSLLSEIDRLKSVSQRNLVAEKRQYSSGDNGSSSSSDSDHQGDSVPQKKRSKIDKADKKESEKKMKFGENLTPLDMNHNGDSSAWLEKIETSSLRDQTKNFLKNKYSTCDELLLNLDDPNSELNKILFLGEKKILRDLKSIIPKKNASVKDSVHGTIELHPLAHLLRNTPEFCRMKHISQLGTVDYVYPCAKGDRLIHSLGTYHLTERLLEKLKAKSGDMMQDANIEERDLLIVKLAALLHDIGHGPWSHFWDGQMIPSSMRDLEIKNAKTGKIEKVHGMQHPYDPSVVITSWSHEDASKAIVRHIFEHNQEVRTKWAEEGMDSNDLEFLIELIDPTPLKGLKDDAPWPMKGRPESHACLYEIVSNKKGGIDTDRMDYLKRDTLICKGNDFDVDYDRIFGKIKIETCNTNSNRTLLVYENGIGSDCMHILAHRDKNHREIYQHKKALAAEQQLAQALDLVKNTLRQKGSDNRWYTMAQSIFDMTAYCKFTEAYVRVNMSSPDERIDAIQSSHPQTGGLEDRNKTIRKLVKAKEIMEDLEQGRIWQCVGVAKFSTKDDATNFYLDREKYVNKICKEILRLEALRAFPQVQVQPGHFHVSKGPNYNMGKKDADPLEYLPIYEEGIIGYREGKGQSFYRQTMTFGSEYCISFFIETEAYLNEAKKIFTRLLEEEKIKHDHISEDFTMTPDARRNKRPCSPSFFNDSGATSASRRKIDF